MRLHRSITVAMVLLALALAALSPSAARAALKGSSDRSPSAVAPRASSPLAYPAAPIAAPQATPAANPGDSVTATLSEIVGGVLVHDGKDTAFTQAEEGYVLSLLGQVQTQVDGKVRLDFSTGTLMRMGPGTLFTLEAPQTGSQGVLNHLKMDFGKLWIILRGGSLEVDTPSGVAAVQGSLMSVDFGATGSGVRVTCLEGHCSLTTPGGTTHILTGQTADTSSPNAPPSVGHMTEQDYLDWLKNMPESAPYIPGLWLYRPHTGHAVSTPEPSPTAPPPSGCQTNCGVGGGNGGAGNGTGNEGKGSGASNKSNHPDGNHGKGVGNGGPLGLTGGWTVAGDPPFGPRYATAVWM